MSRDTLTVILLLGLLFAGGIATGFAVKYVLEGCVIAVNFQQEFPQ